MNSQYDNGDGGLSIVLSPMQLAAIMQGQSITPTETIFGMMMNRTFGGLDMVGGAIELIGSAALFLAPEPTMLSKVGGAALGANGVDNFMNGAIELWTGRSRTSMTERGVTAAARHLGCGPTTASMMGMAVVIAVPYSTAGKLRAARVIEVRTGLIDLQAEEASANWAGGHTILEHIGKDEAYLRKRLAREPHLKRAGTFHTKEKAEKFISKAMRANAPKIQAWTKSANPAPFRLVYDAREIVGIVIPRSTGVLQKASKVRVVLKKTTVDQRIYFVLTAFPDF